jgi:L-iditol 2-dehydrogenase
MRNTVSSKELMRAVVYHGPQKLQIEEVPIPEIRADEMLVKVRSATTCGTDVKTYLRGHPKYPPPFQFGHEFAGDIVRVGAMVENLKPGMRVTASCFGPCGACYPCKHHQENLCENMAYNFGTYAEFVRLTGPFVRWNTLVIPENLSYPQAALLEPLASVVHGHKLLRIHPGESVAILGGGGAVGLMHLQVAKASGAAEIIVVDLVEERLEFAKNLGASRVLTPGPADTVETIREMTGGRGVDVAIECAGMKQTWEAATQIVRKGGRVLWFGGLRGGTVVELDAPAVHYGEITLYNTHGNAPADFWEACNLVAAGIVDTRYLLSGEMALEETEKALQMMIEGKAMKISINPDL